MALVLENLNLQIAHFKNFREFIPNLNECCVTTIDTLLELGVLEVSTAFECAVANVGGHQVVSLSKGDLLRNGKYSDAKLSTVRTAKGGTYYGASIKGIYNKVGTLRVQVYERKQNKFYYFAIPRRAYSHISKLSNIEIPFELDGTPRRVPMRSVAMNWWRYEVKTFDEMAKK
jgi:hypothetical protein